MSSDFAEMLKDTLTKMQERIEFANKQYEDDNDTNMMKRLDDLAAGKTNWANKVINIFYLTN